MAGEAIKVWASGAWQSNNWIWVAGLPVYLDASGELTQVPSETMVGLAVSYNKMVWQPNTFKVDNILTLGGHVLVNDGNVLCNSR